MKGGASSRHSDHMCRMFVYSWQCILAHVLRARGDRGSRPHLASVPVAMATSSDFFQTSEFDSTNGIEEGRRCEPSGKIAYISYLIN